MVNPQATDPGKRPFRFGVGLKQGGSKREWVDKCRKAEELGYDVLGVADHLGRPAPFPSLVLAAETTQRCRLATFVLNAGFYQPALLVRDITTTDELTDGRLELGLGTGYDRRDFDRAGLVFPTPRARVDHLARTVEEIRRHFPRPVDDQKQRTGPPLWIPGRGDRLLALAAREADIVGFTGFAPGNDGDIAYLTDREGVAERVAYVKKSLGTRLSRVELNIYVWRVVVTDHREREAERLAPLRTLSAERMLDVPTVLIGTARQIIDQLIEYRELFGFSYITVEEFNLDALAPVIELARGQ
ncbi:TIGR03621 family F420-dependent LLM class oxidoreductase [Amycolatopsis alba]|uniref:LLM class F420-dependent oxidoreductase n=1 Tax=Amycolatopsis alba DSM 44262 TaxID=1125972 RepID=A0A229RR25_AMYAL|nr:TIGR03621 family F420-dependent LLM class oxidoreductase [Amycolatopsis alba]OXM48854.1 LLM class F420-dependent oxidoreductase [Amycolatopsis alba DSM 44262]